ncbi:type II secretion system protein [Sulfurospirillum sp.]|nr:type II secretion system protein [Sulfurospirillum sp.]
MRKGFSLLTALIFLILIATISALSISLSTQSVKQTTDIYLKSQSELLVRSGVEYALLAISGHNYASDGCLESINMTYNNTHDINISIMYIGNGLTGANCVQLGTNIDTNESNRTVIIDTWVRTQEGIVSEPIVMHRRSIQKP